MRSTSRLLRSLFLLGAFLATLLTAPPAQAGLGVWTSTGPEGTWFRTIVIDPHASSVLYAGVTGGPLLLKSLDAGETWTPAARGIVSDSVQALAADPVHPGVLYAGTNHGVFKSTDGAATWLPLRETFGNAPFQQPVHLLAVDPARPSHVYAGTGGGFFRSTDGGSTWTRVNGRRVYAVVFDPSDPANILVGLDVLGVLRSQDGGASFAPVAGVPGDMYCIAFDPLTAGTVLATSWGAVYRSKDGGGTWERIADTALPLGTKLAVAPGPAGTVLYAGHSSVFKSIDGGVTWIPSGTGLPPMALEALAIDAGSPSTLYAAGTVGAYRSTDGGLSWQSINRGLPFSFVGTLAIDPVDPQVLYASLLDGGLVKSGDGGRTWRPINQGLSVDSTVYALAVDPSDPSVVWAGTHRSTDGGETWELRAGGNTGEQLGSHATALAIDPRRTSTVWAGTFDGLYKTTDSGATWRRVYFGLFQWEPGVYSILADPLRSIVYVNTGEGIVRSRDGGETWKVSGAGLEATLLALDPRDPNILYAAAGEDLFRSTDGGDTWRPLASDLPARVERLLIDPRDSAVLYAAIYEQGVLRSTDGGVHWSFFNEGLTNRIVQALRFAAGDPAILHVATYGGGVFTLTLVSSPPGGEWLTTDAMPGFRVKARLTSAGAAPVAGRKEARCLPETLCVSGALPGRPEVFLRVIGPRPNGFLWVQIVRFTPSQVELWVEQESTGEARSYLLEAVPRDSGELPGLIDRTAFRP